MTINVLEYLTEHYNIEIAQTGSRVICNPPPTDTDEDWLILSKEDDEDLLFRDILEMGFFVEGDYLYPDYELLANSQFLSFRKGTINFILTSNQDFFERFKRATKIAKRLNLLQKSDRIALFQRILYDNKNYKL